MIRLIFLLLFFAPATLMAQCIFTYQPGPAAGKDAHIFNLPCTSSYAQQNGQCDTANFGTSNGLSASAWTWQSTPGKMRGVIEFNLDSLANAGCTVNSAIIHLYSTGPSGGTHSYHCGSQSTIHPCNSNAFRVERITQAWDEHTVTWINQPTTTDVVPGQDYVDVPDQSDPYYTYEVDITDMVNFWLANPAQNHGMMLKLLDEINYYKKVRFASSDNPDASIHPKLVLETNCPGSCNNLLSGTVYEDTDGDCLYTGADNPIANQIIKIQPGPIFASTDSNGYYSAVVSGGTHTITHINPNPNIWTADCPNPYQYIRTVNSNDTVHGNDFGMEASVHCPVLTVDIGSAFLRKCHTELYGITYCNIGNVDATGVYIDVEFSPDLTPLTSSLPWTQNGNIYSFWIDSLAAGECDMIHVDVQVSCSTNFGDFECVEAIILPLFECANPGDSTWDRSSVMVEGECIGDSLACFVITNTGDVQNGFMQGTSDFRIYENNVLVHTGTFQLAGQADTVICWPTNGGNTIRLEADQRPGHPGNSHPNDVVSSCGAGYQAFNYQNSMPEDDAQLHMSHECEEVVSSYDPNDKNVMPAGVHDPHFIQANLLMEYKIRFQNTGNDTALDIYIMDTLSQYLDVTTFQPGASSHPYSWELTGPGVVKFDFPNIMLVDSNTNEPLSHGFVKFRIMQMPGLEEGTRIENEANIFFDFNAPVLTNTAYSTIGKIESWSVPNNGVDTTTTGIADYDDIPMIQVYPNPFSETATVELFDMPATGVTLELYNMMGEQVLTKQSYQPKFQIHSGDLSNGVYLWRVVSEDKVSGTGRLILRR